MMLSVDSKVAERKQKLKELSLESPIRKVDADTVNRVENNIDIPVWQECAGFSVVIDPGMLYIVMMRQLGSLRAFNTQIK